jgi:hypothetical protein
LSRACALGRLDGPQEIACLILPVTPPPSLATTPVGCSDSPAACLSLAAICEISSGSGPGANTAGCAGRSNGGAPSG